MRRAVEFALAAAAALWQPVQAAPACERPVYLTFDTGHMGVADLVADVLARHDVKVTFFLANEKTQDGGSSLDARWAAWWKARAAEGHAFGSHTWDHVVWQADVAAGLKARPTAGEQAGQTQVLDAADYCEQLRRPARWFTEATGQAMLPLFRAPAGRTSARLLEAARQCGFRHVGWAPAGFLGDELPSERFPNRLLRDTALRDIREGDILVAHLGIWSRKDPWAPAVLEPLIEGLKARGFCFRTLAEHPQYRDWITKHPLN
ncbi:polysaccharide deacetylase family protein [Caldimonas sp. KR1-144]|uniref:polysaccharide deacetylase family protein n=1 Tax=Caldimonas sp. KR1-144 TaxID=3400911 RepID=UPI003BFF5B35